MKHSTLRYYLSFSGMLLLFYMSLTSSFAMFQAWVSQELMLNSGQIGIIYTLVALTALVFAPIFGAWQDALGTAKTLLIIIGIGLMCCTPIMGWLFVLIVRDVSFTLGAIVAGLYFGTILISGVGAVETYCERGSRHVGFEYGNVRLWASIGCALAASLSGFWLKLNPQICFYIATAGGILFLSILWSLDARSIQSEEDKNQGGSNSLRQSLDLVRHPTFWWLTLFLFAVSGGFQLFDQQFPLFFSSLFQDAGGPEQGKKVAGIILATQMLCDAGFLLVIPLLVNKIGARNGLLLAGVVMTIRIGGSGISYSPILAGFFKLMQAIEMPLLIVSTFKYIAKMFDERYGATVYLVSFQCSQQVAGILLSSVLGLGYNNLGFHPTYLIMAGVIALFTVQAYFTLPRHPEQIRGTQ